MGPGVPATETGRLPLDMKPCLAEPSRQHLGDHVSPHVREPEIASLEPEGQPEVIQAQQVKDRRLDVVDVDAVRDRGEAELVGLAQRRCPAFTPPPANHMVMASMWWLRPTDSRISPIGVRPNSPPQTTSVSSRAGRAS